MALLKNRIGEFIEHLEDFMLFMPFSQRHYQSVRTRKGGGEMRWWLALSHYNQNFFSICLRLWSNLCEGGVLSMTRIFSKSQRGDQNFSLRLRGGTKFFAYAKGGPEKLATDHHKTSQKSRPLPLKNDSPLRGTKFETCLNIFLRWFLAFYHLNRS